MTTRDEDRPAWYTSYEINWRADFDPRPDFALSSRSVEFVGPNGDPLFTITTADGVPSDGILTLIREAPRIRDELNCSTSALGEDERAKWDAMSEDERWRMHATVRADRAAQKLKADRLEDILNG